MKEETNMCRRCGEKEIIHKHIESCSDCGEECAICELEYYVDDMRRCDICDVLVCNNDGCVVYPTEDPQEEALCYDCAVGAGYVDENNE